MPKTKIPKVSIKLPKRFGPKVATAALKRAERDAIPALTDAQKRKMSARKISKYNRRRQAANRADFEHAYRQAKRAAVDPETRALELKHGTIRQGMIELFGAGSEGAAAGVGSAAISRGSSATNAIDQNTAGGLIDPSNDGTEENEDWNPQGTTRAKHGRVER